MTLTTAPGINCQTPATPASDQDQKIRIGTAEVALDIVVRDKKGRPVKDLTAADFEIYEDGARQQIESFRLVTREAGASTESRPGAAPATTATPAPSIPGLIALVFDRLTPEARALARRAASAYADEGLSAGDYAGVFGIDLSLRLLQTYTDNPQLIKQAVEQATSTSTSTYVSNTQQMRSLSERSMALDRQINAGTSAAAQAGAGRDSSGAGGAGAAVGAAAAEQLLIQMQARMLQTFETLERDQQGYATINALLAVINSMRNLPGRKTIIFFSEGLALPPSVQVKFGSVINAANRAQVSIYPIDAAGLRIDSPNAEATREINALAQQRMEQAHRGRDDNSGPLTRALERNEDLLRLNPHSGLGQLADQTGGFLIRDTNDLSAGLRRIDEDMHAHYLITYVPTNQVYDGRFRQIDAKLKRPNLDVQTRKGYYAVEPAGTSPVLDYEIPALAALGASRPVNSFALRAAGMSFPEAKRPGLTPVLVEIPLSSLSFITDKEKGTYAADFAIVVVVRDRTKQIAQKLSQHYPLSGPAGNLEQVRKGEVLFYRELELPPGDYTLEAVAYDAKANKASVRNLALNVPAIDEKKPRLSSLVLLKRADKLSAEERKKENPFHFGEVIVYPNLGEPLPKSTVKQLAFFFTAWPAAGSKEKMALTLEIHQNGRAVGQIPAELPAPDESGRVKYASAIPLENFPPGSYEMKIIVKQGAESVSRAVQFQVQP